MFNSVSTSFTESAHLEPVKGSQDSEAEPSSNSEVCKCSDNYFESWLLRPERTGMYWHSSGNTIFFRKASKSQNNIIKDPEFDEKPVRKFMS